MISRLLTLTTLMVTTLATAGFAAVQARPTRIGAGGYSGAVRCTGSDRFSDGSPTRRYNSRPRASVVFASDRRLKRWTYFFLGRHNTVIQSRAVRSGQSFTYAAGAHIDRPGRTRATVLGVVRAARRVEVLARLDWSSPSTHYIGSGLYELTLQSTGQSAIRYDVIKVVIKLPDAGASAANPIIRRTEHCAGMLSR